MHGKFVKKTKHQAGPAGQSNPISPLFLKQDDCCAVCKVASVNCGGTAALKRCGRCFLVYYCSKECQVQDYKHHKPLCKDKQDQVKLGKTNVLSVSEMMKQGRRILMNESGAMYKHYARSTLPAAATLSDQIQVPVAAMRVTVSSADRSNTVEANALFSAATKVSSVSEKLANTLGLVRNGEIFVTGIYNSSIAYLPSRHVDISFVNKVCTNGASAIPNAVRLALVIAPTAGNDLVLGFDLLQQLSGLSGRQLVQDFSPDMLRIRFLPEHADEPDESAMQELAEMSIAEGDYIEVAWGYPDRTPAYDPRGDMSHHVLLEHEGRARIIEIASTL